MTHEHKHECGCCDDEESAEDISPEELTYHVNDKFEALLSLLVKKKIMTEKEFEKEFETMCGDFEEEETDKSAAKDDDSDDEEIEDDY